MTALQSHRRNQPESNQNLLRARTETPRDPTPSERLDEDPKARREKHVTSNQETHIGSDRREIEATGNRIVTEKERRHDESRRGERETTPHWNKQKTKRKGNSEVQNGERHLSFEKHGPPHRPMPRKETVNRSSFKEIAQELLPRDMFLRDTAAQMMENQVVEFREKFVNQNMGRTRDAERVSVAPSPIKPIHVRKVKRGPLGVLAAELRSFLPEQCVRGLSFYGKDCLEMLVEESMEPFARNILSYLGYKPLRSRKPLNFNDRGSNTDNQDFVDRCIAGAMIRWKRGSQRNPHKPAREWYQTQLDRVAQGYLYIARDVLQL